MNCILNIRIPEEMAAELHKREQDTDVPTSAFVRRAIRTALSGVSVIDVESEPAQLPAPVAAKIQVLKVKHVDESKADQKPAPVSEPKSEQKSANIHTRLAAQKQPLLLTSNVPPRFSVEKDGDQ